MKRILPSASRRDRFRSVALLACTALILAAAAAGDSPPPELLSELLQKVSATAEFRERLLTTTRSIPKIGGWLSPNMVDRLRSAILGKDWHRVDHFPGWTVAALNHSVEVTMHLAGPAHKPLTVNDLIDLGDWPLDRPGALNLDQRATAPTYAEDPETAVNEIAPGITMGDGPDAKLAPMHAESKRLAEALNRLSLNAPATPLFTVELAGHVLADPAALIAALAATGHTVMVDDDLFFANFGHLHDGPRDVMMPFWLDTQIAIPASRRSLLVPVSHSEHELHVRGPAINADVSYYFGIDGKSEFRTMDSLNQPWVLGRQAFTYQGASAVQVIDLLAQATRVYLAVHLSHPELPFGGYYTLGVCQDTNAAIEMALQGRVLLFPLTRDSHYFPAHPAALHLEPRDQPFLQLLTHVPTDRSGGLPPVDRVLGSLPAADLTAITIPGLAADLQRVETARTFGLVQRTHPLLTAFAAVAALLGILALAFYLRGKNHQASHQRK